MPSSMTLKLPNHRTVHATSPAGRIHHWKPMPVSILMAIATPPSSAVSSSVSMMNSAPSGTIWKWMPKRSRTAAAIDRLLTAATRPAISARAARKSVAAATAHNKENPNSAPAWTDVEIEPTSTNPPMLVTIPSVRLKIFFMAGQ